MKTKLIATLMLAGTSLFAGPRFGIGVGIGVPAPVVVAPAPVVVAPPVVTTYVPPCPGPGYVWLGGSWVFRGGPGFYGHGYVRGPVYHGYRGFRRYGETKLANILFTAELARRLEGSGVIATCFHPGFVATGFNRNNGAMMSFGMTLARPFARRPEKGAETLVWLVDSPSVSDGSGGYFMDRKPAKPSAAAQDMEAARRLWELSEAQTRASSAAG